MKVLSGPAGIRKELRRLIRGYARYYWAVAWASAGSDTFRLLAEKKDRIAKMIVGIHFYQTDPDFILEFTTTPTVRFIMKPDGVFHPKVYLFESDTGEWECIVGSPNFTRAALTDNSEEAVLVSSADVGAAAAYADIRRAIDGYWNQAKYVGPNRLASYKAMWERKRRSLANLSGRYGDPGRSAEPPMNVPLLRMSWEEYFQRVAEEGVDVLTERRRVLKKAAELFRSHDHFDAMDAAARKGIAGFGPNEPTPWAWFGSMRGAGYFKQAINANAPSISAALGEIPRDGDVNQGHYQNYVRLLKAGFPSGGVDAPTATRLLAMKRPDYFACLTGKNRTGLCRALRIPTHVTLHNYWDRIVARLSDSVWWGAKEPEDDVQRDVWRGRAAFVDSLFYREAE
jgi:hypothetical protein